MSSQHVRTCTYLEGERAIQRSSNPHARPRAAKKKKESTNTFRWCSTLSSRFLGPGFQFLSPCRSTLGHTEKCRDVSPPASELIRVIPAPRSIYPSVQKRTGIDLSPPLLSTTASPDEWPYLYSAPRQFLCDTHSPCDQKIIFSLHVTLWTFRCRACKRIGIRGIGTWVGKRGQSSCNRTMVVEEGGRKKRREG